MSVKNHRDTRHSKSPSRRRRRRARQNRYIRDTYNSASLYHPPPPHLPSLPSCSLVLLRPLSFCRCNLSPLITRIRKFVHISVPQSHPLHLLSFCSLLSPAVPSSFFFFRLSPFLPFPPSSFLRGVLPPFYSIFREQVGFISQKRRVTHRHFFSERQSESNKLLFVCHYAKNRVPKQLRI